MKMHRDDDEEFRDERVKDIIKTTNNFMKRGKKDNGLKSSSDNTVANEASKSMYES